MSDTFENFCSAHMLQDRVCGVAYTLNDTQPVVCTHIGDQPLFYMDKEIIDEDDNDLFTIEELGKLAKEIQILKQEIQETDLTSPMEEKTITSFLEFGENMEDISVLADLECIYKNTDTKAQIKEIKEILNQSRLGAAYLNIADQNNITIMMSEQVETAGYDRRSGTILLYPHTNITEQTLLLARELRRHWQHRQGAMLNPLSFSPEHAILINRAQEADLSISIIRIAWELQLAGNKEMWERVERSPMADLARAFAREAFIDFRTLNNGEAATAAFESWFFSERCCQKDKTIIQSMLADHSGYILENEQSSQSITVELIAALGEMPFGKNYLSKYAHIIINDPIFTEIRDRSSANFLWFIKFERSFKQAEQELQSESNLSTHGARHDLYNTKSQDRKNDISTGSNVIQLFEQSPAHTPQKRAGGEKNNTNAGENIIDLGYWPNGK